MNRWERIKERWSDDKFQFDLAVKFWWISFIMFIVAFVFFVVMFTIKG